MSDSEQFLTVTPLGGLGEIGLNCQLWETSAGVVMVDCGLMFPDDFHLGVDVVIPHFGAVSAVRDKLLGIVLTHGHEDHIGALPWPWWSTNSGSTSCWTGWSCARWSPVTRWPWAT